MKNRISIFVTLVLVACASVSFAQAPTATTTPKANATTGGVGFLASQAVTSGGQPGDVTVSFSYATGGSFALATGDYINLAKIPQGARVTDFYISIPDMDSGTTLTLRLATSSLSASLVGTPIATGQAGGILVISTSGVMVMPTSVLTASDALRLTAVAGATGAGAGGTISGWVRYNQHNPGGF